MRVVISCVPQTGHITPVLPLAMAFAEQGDDVILASGPDAEAAAVSHGLTFVPVGPPFGEWFEALRQRTRGMPGDGLAPEAVERYFLPRLFGEIGTALMVDDLMELGREFRPDLLIFDPYVFAGPLVGGALDIPVAQHLIGLANDPMVLDLVADAVSPIWREFGLSVPAHAGVHNGTTIAICPRTLDPRSSMARCQELRPTPPPIDPPPRRPVEVPRPEDPVVYVTLGTFSNSLEQFRTLLGVLADEPINVVATVGRDNDPAQLAPWPPNAVIDSFIPQHELLPHCHAVVHHAGAGTTFGLLAHGLPSVALPQSADNFRIAKRLAASGAAVTLMPGEASPDQILAALRDVMAAPRYREAAVGLAAEIRAMPEPATLAANLRSVIV